MFVVFIASILPVSAQDMGSGGAIIEPNFGDDPKTFNPIISQDGVSNNAISRMFPDFIAVDAGPDAKFCGHSVCVLLVC